MEYTNNQLKTLFLRQSYLDAWEDYERSLNKQNFIRWDYVILTASNEAQADTYREQIDYRLAHEQLPKDCHYAVLPDPDGKRVGSGGATFNVMRYVAEQEEKKGNVNNKKLFRNKRILVIHSGGDSKRVPQYSACGKLFSPVPRELPDGRGSTLFDEFMIAMSGVPSRFGEGMLVLSGDVLLLFNPLQIDSMFHGAAAISIKEHVSTGKNHGVFLNDGNDYVARFLHKQSEEHLKEIGAVNKNGCVDLDTGAILFDCELLEALFSLISVDGVCDAEKFQEFVNEDARISFYGDFLYPLAQESTLEDFYKEAAEGTINDKLLSCREKIWKAIRGFSLKMLCLSPAEFIHFGTTRELRSLLVNEIEDYRFLDWKKKVMCTGGRQSDFSAHNAYVGHAATIAEDAYLENCYVLGEAQVMSGAVVSNVHLRDCQVPGNTVWHGLKLNNDSYVVRVYGTEDNPKGRKDASFLGITLAQFIQQNNISCQDLWETDEDYLWFAKLYPVCKTQEDAVKAAELIGRMASASATEEEIEWWRKSERVSLYSSFNKADVLYGNQFERELESRILANKFIAMLEDGVYYKDALKVFGRKGITEEIYKELMKDAGIVSEQLKIRIYYAMSRFMKSEHVAFGAVHYDELETKCFSCIQESIYHDAVAHLPQNAGYQIQKEHVNVSLPVRVNWGGGWTDTPPYCNEKGGTVLNAALKLKGIRPIQVTVRRLEKLVVEFASEDIGVTGTITDIKDIRDCHNPFDSFALHKAALIACGIIPLDGEISLQDVLKKLGGGIFLSTQVVGVPKGSGLGTSSILSAACVKALFEFLDTDLKNDTVADIVLGMEQIMSTGGGWQDQVGGLTDGIKFIRSEPGVHQTLQIENVQLDESTKQELQKRFALIYTGQRRLARNLLRDVVGGYIGGRPESVSALKEMEKLAVLMKFELERGNVDNFAELLNEHWEFSKQLDAGTTNTCIDQMFLACEDLISGRFIAGAGGGGFLQVILKKGVTREILKQRLHSVFQDSGVDVWECELLLE